MDETVRVKFEADVGRLESGLDRMGSTGVRAIDRMIKANQRQIASEARIIAQLQQQGEALAWQGKEAEQLAARIESASARVKELGAENDRLRKQASAAGKSDPTATMRKGLSSAGSLIKSLTTRLVVLFGAYKLLSAAADYVKQAALQNEEFRSSLATLKGSLATAFQPILEFIIPILTKLMNALSVVIQYVGAFFSMLAGKSYDASKKSASALSSTLAASDKTASGLQDNAQKIEEAMLGPTASFDKFNDITQPKTNTGTAATASGVSSGSGGGGISDVAASFDFKEPAGLQSFLDKMKGVGTKIKEIFKPAGDEFKNAKQWFKDFGESDTWKAAKSGFSDFYEKALKPLGEWVVGTALPKVFQGIAKGITAAAKGAALIVAGIGIALGWIVNTAAPAVKKFFTKTLPDGIKKFPENVKKFFKEAYTNIAKIFGNIGQWFKDRWNDIKNFFLNVVPTFFKQKFQDAKDNISLVFGAIGTWFSNRWTDIKNAFSAVGTWFKTQFETAYTNIQGVFGVIGTWFANRWTDIKNAFSAVGTWFQTQFTTAWNNITGVFSSIGTWFANRWTDIKNAFSAVGTWFNTQFNTAWANIQGVFAGIGGWFSARWGDITGVFSGVGTWFSDKFGEAWTNIKNIFSWTNITNFFSEAWKTVKNCFGSLGAILADSIWAPVKDGINSALGSAESLLNQGIGLINSGISGIEKLLGNKISLGRVPTLWLPRLTKGGLAYGETIAMVGDNPNARSNPEVIAPLDMLQAQLQRAITSAILQRDIAGGAGGGSPIEVRMTLGDGKELVRMLIDPMNRTAKSLGYRAVFEPV